MKTQTHNYADALRGDTIKAKRFTMLKKENQITSAMDLTGVGIKADFKYKGKVLSKSIGSGITVIDAVAGVFEIDKMVFNTIGTYDYDIQLTFPHADVQTYIQGQIKIIKDITE